MGLRRGAEGVQMSRHIQWEANSISDQRKVSAIKFRLVKLVNSVTISKNANKKRKKKKLILKLIEKDL